MSAIITDNPFSQGESQVLTALVGMMIPASEKHQVPGADDPLILADIVTTSQRHAEVFHGGLKGIAESCQSEHGVPFSDLVEEEKKQVVSHYTREMPQFMFALMSVTAQCYYRDVRVMESLGMEARAPFPAGYELEQGDWSLLEPVRARGAIWRDTST